MTKHRHASRSAPERAAYRQQHANRRHKLMGWWIGAGIGIVLLIAGAMLLFRPTSTLPAEISAMRAFEEYRQGALFLDVRSQDEWNQGHIQESMLIPLDELAGRLNELPRDQDIVVVCRSGARSAEAAAILRQAGFTRVTCIVGGLQSWISAGYPLEE